MLTIGDTQSIPYLAFFFIAHFILQVSKHTLFQRVVVKQTLTVNKEYVIDLWNLMHVFKNHMQMNL